ncbi:phosphoribosyl-AMP cyclohydrolase [Methanothermococcus okinawensis]|uniref:Phosphoribosyl-AMP cyclohydrolase n=1 Tax=Methanothermococcus okinawensis (strain DSM 14208 / JCM 11175 / IH1) TaxID=647113 RepID=F8AN33_METOI|nr:phosphoribosyl-AMP cyclohydrolase [Methanothermococcus okinawensis]AEH06947.1 Phosphoribosyl-AMP cyclohydrolase [Methanothermococcus okinawensis IH1]
MDVDAIIKNLNLKFRNIDGNKLLIAIATDKDKNVLMTAFMSKESLKKTFETGYMHYYSTSRKKLWKKGEESGNVQKVKEIYRDCDGDALLFVVEQTGWACHEGYYSCFHYKLDLENNRIYTVGDKFD